MLAFALMYLGEHYFVDILVGWFVALAAAFIVETALGNGPGARWLRRRRTLERLRGRDSRAAPGTVRQTEIGEAG